MRELVKVDVIKMEAKRTRTGCVCSTHALERALLSETSVVFLYFDEVSRDG